MRDLETEIKQLSRSKLSFILFVTSKTQAECFVVKPQIDNFGDSFLLKIKIERKRKFDSFFLRRNKL